MKMTPMFQLILLFLLFCMYINSFVLNFHNRNIISQQSMYQNNDAVSVDSIKVSQELSSKDVSHILIVHKNDSADNLIRADNDIDSASFGDMFWQCAPYIAMHRNNIIVIHIPSHAFDNKTIFNHIIDDIAIVHLLGMKIVLVLGVRSQLDDRMISSGSKPVYHDGIRIADEKTLSILKEVSGYARYEVESAFARGFRGQPGQSGINVVSGNFFYTAKPFGVRLGIDYKLTGEVRKIEVDNIKQRLDLGDIVLLTSLGYSRSGEVFNVQSEVLAAECSIKLNAVKIIFYTKNEVIIDKKNNKLVQNLRLAQAEALLQSYGLNNGKQNNNSTTNLDKVEIQTNNQLDNKPNQKNEIFSDYLCILSRAVDSLMGGVKRAHLISPIRGALLKELYTRDGSGMLISRDIYEGIRPAQPVDLRSIEEIINPLVEQGILIARTRDQLEKDLPDTFIFTRDSTTLALGMLKIFDDFGEVCCLAVHPKYRREGKGETMLAYLERRAILMGINKIFVLSTHTMQWFEERGFVLSDPMLLPKSRKYNTVRASKVYIKHLGTQRDIDAEELLWNV